MRLSVANKNGLVLIRVLKMLQHVQYYVYLALARPGDFLRALISLPPAVVIYQIWQISTVKIVKISAQKSKVFKKISLV